MAEDAAQQLEQDMAETIRKYSMIPEGTSVLAAVSGGADSMCLLMGLWDLQKSRHFPLRVLHVHHGIRESADRDAAFVGAYCREKQIPFELVRCDVPAFARERGMGLEEAARFLRYEALLSSAQSWEKEEGRPVRIALAHHLEDQAETVLFHLARGSSLAGVSGMRPVNGRYIRPLLSVSRQEIEAALASRGVTWVEDETNRDLSYARNRIRRQILPEMTRYLNQGAVRHIADFAADAGETEDYLAEVTRKKTEALTLEDGGIDIKGFLLEDTFLQKRILYAAITERAGQKKDITSQNVAEVLRLLAVQGNGSCDLPYGLAARKSYGRLYILEKSQEIPQGEACVPRAPGDYQIRSFPFSGRMSDIPQKKYTKWFDYDKISPAFSFRKRRPGDYLILEEKTVLGDGSEVPEKKKTIKKFMIDARMPRSVRDVILLPADGAEILWVPGYRMGARCRVSSRTKTILEITAVGGEHGRDNHNADPAGKS